MTGSNYHRISAKMHDDESSHVVLYLKIETHPIMLLLASRLMLPDSGSKLFSIYHECLIDSSFESTCKMKHKIRAHLKPVHLFSEWVCRWNRREMVGLHMKRPHEYNGYP
jgi:hypothetical protein